jgi:hypothetical protein
MLLGITTWEKVAAIATAVGGVGAAAGAVAAWRAALASDTASRDATDALAASLKPQVQLTFDQAVTSGGTLGAVIARLFVAGPLSQAGLAEVHVCCRRPLGIHACERRHGSNSIALLEPGGSRMKPEGSLIVTIGEPSDAWPPPDGDHVTATVTYSDVRGAAHISPHWIGRPASASVRCERSATPSLLSRLGLFGAVRLVTTSRDRRLKRSPPR